MNKIATSTISKLNHNGCGITHLDGKVVFVEEALPGEVVSWEQTKHLAKFDRARLIKVISAALERVAPPCKHYAECGGCSLQHLALAKQIAFKQDVVAELLAHQLKLNASELPFETPIVGRGLGYRRKARLGVKYLKNKNRLIIGFHEKRGRYLADLTSCPVLEPAIGTKLEALRALLSSLSIYDAICQLEVAVTPPEAAVVIRNLKPLNDEDEAKLAKASKDLQLQFYIQSGGLDTVQPLLGADSYLSYTLGAIRLFFKPTSFVQINALVNEQLVAKVLAWLDVQVGETIIDFYCGMGNFSLPIAKLKAHVAGFEGEEGAVATAKYNASFNHLESLASFKVMDLNQPDLSALQTLIKTKKVNKIVLDPPRTGALALLTELNNLNLSFKKIIYVSCNPSTLARDCACLVAKGYVVQRLLVADMYPHTAHVETVVELVHD